MSRMSPRLRPTYESAQSSAKIKRSGAMKYILMMNTTERGPYNIFNWPTKDFEAHIAYWKSLNTELKNLGELVAVEALTGPDQAKLVRADKNGMPVTDGVFPESKEFLAGYWTRRGAIEHGDRSTAGDDRSPGRTVVMPPLLDTHGEHLLRELAPQVLGVVARRFSDFAAAEDAVQEA